MHKQPTIHDDQVRAVIDPVEFVGKCVTDLFSGQFRGERESLKFQHSSVNLAL